MTRNTVLLSRTVVLPRFLINKRLSSSSTCALSTGRILTDMSSDGDNEGGGDNGGRVIGVPPRRGIPHYHGDEARTVFVVSAIVIIVAQSTGANLPLSTSGAVVSAAMLVIAAGVTNP